MVNFQKYGTPVGAGLKPAPTGAPAGIAAEKDKSNRPISNSENNEAKLLRLSESSSSLAERSEVY
jgi:hypothetical protein